MYKCCLKHNNHALNLRENIQQDQLHFIFIPNSSWLFKWTLPVHWIEQRGRPMDARSQTAQLSTCDQNPSFVQHAGKITDWVWSHIATESHNRRLSQISLKHSRMLVAWTGTNCVPTWRRWASCCWSPRRCNIPWGFAEENTASCFRCSDTTRSFACTGFRIETNLRFQELTAAPGDPERWMKISET